MWGGPEYCLFRLLFLFLFSFVPAKEWGTGQKPVGIQKVIKERRRKESVSHAQGPTSSRPYWKSGEKRLTQPNKRSWSEARNYFGCWSREPKSLKNQRQPVINHTRKENERVVCDDPWGECLDALGKKNKNTWTTSQARDLQEGPARRKKINKKEGWILTPSRFLRSCEGGREGSECKNKLITNERQKKKESR